MKVKLGEILLLKVTINKILNKVALTNVTAHFSFKTIKLLVRLNSYLTGLEEYKRHLMSKTPKLSKEEYRHNIDLELEREVEFSIDEMPKLSLSTLKEHGVSKSTIETISILIDNDVE